MITNGAKARAAYEDKHRRVDGAAHGIPGATVIDAEPPPSVKPPRRSRPIKALADEIFAFAKLPRLSWGFGELDRYAPFIAGGTAGVMGATGRGKTTFVLQVGRHHARRLGPVLIVSAELIGAIAGARMASSEMRKVWASVLSGNESEDAIRAALDVPNMRIIDEVTADILKVIEDELAVFADEYPGKPALVIVDYVQLLPGCDEIRHRVTENVVALRKLAAKYSAGVLLISKAGRTAAKQLRSGEAMGTDATEGGAETNAIEHETIALLALGAMRPVKAEDPDGPSIVDVSIAKARFGVADKIVPLWFDGATGRFQDHGPAVSATDRRAEAKAKGKNAKVETLVRAVLGLVAKSPKPMSKADITRQTTGNNSDIAAAIKRLEETGELVPVAGYGVHRKGGSCPLWTPELAAKRDLIVVSQVNELVVINHE